MDRKNTRFRELTGAMQVRFRELRKAGVGAVVKHAPIVTPEEEDLLWSSEIMGVHSPLALQRAVFYYVGKTFCLRGAEHRDLKISQFVRSEQPDSYNYIENGSKNITGVSTKTANKVVPVYSSPEARPRCLVYLLDLYLSKLPPKAIQLDLFYLRPKKSAESGSWYDCVAVGKEKLRNFLQSMCADAGISEKKTNHSLRATGASALFNAGVPERLIRDVTGHRSSALHLYERPSVQQKQAVSRVLVQGRQSFEQRTKHSESLHTASSSVIGSLFSGLTNCTVTISPQNFIVNATPMPAQSTEVAIDTTELLRGLDVNEFFAED